MTDPIHPSMHQAADKADYTRLREAVHAQTRNLEIISNVLAKQGEAMSGLNRSMRGIHTMVNEATHGVDMKNFRDAINFIAKRQTYALTLSIVVNVLLTIVILVVN